MASARIVEIAFLGNTRDLEAALERAGLVAQKSGARIGDAFNEGTSRAGGALTKLSSIAAGFGIPFTGALDNVGRKLDEAHTKTGRFSTAMAEAGKLAVEAGAVGFAAAGTEAVRLGEKFQTSTASIAANADITQKAANQIGQAFLNTAGHSIFSGQQMAQAYASVAGQLKLTEGHALGTADALRVMTASGNLAEATHASLATSTSALASVMQAYRLSVVQATGASDTLFNVSRSLNVPVDQVAQALNRLHGRLGELAPSLRDTSTLMVEMGQHGITGMRGLNIVNTALTTMMGNSKNTKAVLSDMGVHLFNQQGQFLGLGNAIAQLHPKFTQLNQQQQMMAAQFLFGKSAAQVMLGVIQGGVGQFNQAAQAANKLGTAHQAASLQSRTLHNQMEMLKATVVDLGTKFGLWLIPKLQAVGQAVATVIGWFEKHKAAAQALAIVITGVLGTAVAFFAAQKMAQFVTWMGTGFSAMGRFAQGVGSAAVQIAAKFGLIGTTATTMEGEVGAAAVESGTQMQLFATETKAAGTEVVVASDATAVGVDAAIGSTGLGLIIVGVGIAVTELATHWQQAMQAIESITATIVNAVISVLNDLIGAINSVIQTFNNTIGQITGSIGQLGTIGNVNFGGGGSGGSGGVALYPGGPLVSPSSVLSNFASTPFGQPYNPGVSTVPSIPNISIPSGGGGASPNLASLPGGGGGSGGSGGGGSKSAGKSAGTPRVVSSQLTTNQQIFAGLLSQQTGLNPRVIAAWLLAEESGGAASSRQASSNNDWLNIGYTDSGTFGGGDSIWNNVATAAQATANWLKGQNSIPNYGRAAGSIQAILRTAGQSPNSQISAIQGSGWASSGYPDLPGLYNQLGNIGISGGGSAVARSIRTLLYSNPFGGPVNPERIDMGQDFSMSPGTPIKAIGAGTVEGIMPNWYQGQPYLAYKLSQGPNAGKVVYVAEQINPSVKAGQSLQAGQTIGTYASSGTGIEMGFANPNNWQQTLAQATTGYTEGQVTPAGQAFAKFYQSIGSGVYTTTNSLTGQVTGGGMSIAQLIQQLIQKYLDQLTKTGNTMLTALNTAVQSGTAKTLEKLLGVATGGMMTSALKPALEKYAGQPGGPTSRQITAHILPILEKSMAGFYHWQDEIKGALGNIHGKALREIEKDIGVKWGAATSKIVDVITNAQTDFVNRLTTDISRIHGRILSQLERDVHAKHGSSAGQLVTDITSLHGKKLDHLTSTLEKSHNTHLRKLGRDIAGGPGTAQGVVLDRLLKDLKGTHNKHLETLAKDVKSGAHPSQQAASFALLVAELKATHNHALQQLAQGLLAAHRNALLALGQELYAEQMKKDAEGLNLQATQLKDQTSIIQHMSDTIVQGIRDAVQAITDSFSAVAQSIKDKTQSMTDSTDAQVKAIQDASKITTDTLAERGLYGLNLVAQQQQVALDQMTQQFDQQIASAQAAVDAAQTQTDNTSAAVTAFKDAVAAHENTLVAAAQAKLDSVTKSTDAAVQRAQNAVEQAATGSKSTQDAAQGQLEYAQGQAAVLQAQAQAALTAAQNQANQVGAQADKALANAQGNAQVILAMAQQQLQQVSGQAQTAEAQQQAIVEKTLATASTQFAGSGLTINIMGLPMTDAAAIAQEVGWQLRTAIPA